MAEETKRTHKVCVKCKKQELSELTAHCESKHCPWCVRCNPQTKKLP